MTNREWLMNKIQNMSDEEFNQMEFQKLKNEEMDCGRKNCAYRDCDKCELEWLKAEHKEVIKLSEAERVILGNIPKEYEWIARDNNKRLCIYLVKPSKGQFVWRWRVCSRF